MRISEAKVGHMEYLGLFFYMFKQTFNQFWYLIFYITDIPFLFIK